MMNLDEYIFDLDSPIEETRARAIMSLVKSNDDRAIPYLEKASEHDESAQIRYYARKGLKLIKSRAIREESPPSGGSTSDGNLGPTIKSLLDSANIANRKRGVTLVARLNDPVHYQALEEAYGQENDPVVKSQMLTTLAAIGHDKGRRHIAEALASPNHRLRASAVESVTFLADEELMDQVIPLLQDEDHRVVANATVALKNYGKLNVLNTLSTMIESPEVNQRDAATFALSRFKIEATLPLLVKASRDKEKTVRLKAIEGLKTLADEGSKKAQEILKNTDIEDPEDLTDYFSIVVEDPVEKDLEHEEFSVRLEAVKEIVKATARDKLPILKEAFEKETDAYVKATMVLAIGQLGTSDDARYLLAFLESTEPRVRANAVEAVGCIASPENLESLLPYLGDRNNRVRANAVIALKNAYPGKAIETLKLMAGSDDLRMKISAAYACFEIGSEAAVGILKGLAADDDIRVAGKAIWSLDMLKEKGNAVASKALNELNIKVGDLNETDSFIGIDDGSFIRLTPSPEPGEKPSEKSYGQQSLLASLQSEYGIRAEIDLKDTAQVTRRSAVPLKSGDFKTTGDKYAIVSEIGRGGMGVILSSKDLDIRREVAMKVITDQGKTSREFIERFIEEAQVQGQLEHPNICPVHELGRDSNGRIYFTMKIVKGRSLAEMIKRWKLTPVANSHQRITEALNIFLKICDGVAFAHSKGVIHRDLKPANIMVGDFGEVYVMDWGLAKIIGVEDDCKDDLVITDRQEDGNVIKTMAGSVIGTPVYMPPEQAKGQVDLMDERSDIYSLGAVLYELLTLDIPFTGTSPWDVIRKVTADPPVPVTEKVAEGTIASELNTIVMKCLEKEPGERYRNVKELKAEVELFLAGKPIAAMEYNLWQILRKWADRNKTLATASLAVIVILVVSIIFTSVAWRTAEYQKTIAEQEEAKAMEQKAIAEREKETAEEQRGIAERERRRTEEQKVIAERERKEALAQKDIAQKAQWESDRSLINNLINQGKLWMERGNYDEAAKIFQELKLKLLNVKKSLFPFVDLVLCFLENVQGNYVPTVLGTHGVRAYAVAFSPNGKLIASGGADETIKLWDVARKELITSFDNTKNWAFTVAFSRDGKLLASANLDRTIKLWDIAQGKELAILTGHEREVTSVDFSPDGKLLASCGGEQAIRIWELASRKNIATLKKQKLEVNAVRFNPNGDLLASAGCSDDPTIVLWDVAQRKEIATLTGHEKGIVSIAFSPDGTMLASGSVDKTVKLWDVAGRKEICTLVQKRFKSMLWSGSQISELPEASAVAFSPDGKYLVFSSDDYAIKFWDISQKSEAITLRKHTSRIWTIAFSPNGEGFASSSNDGSVILWEKDQSKAVTTFSSHEGAVASVAFSPDGRYLASGSTDTTVKLWDVARQEEIISLGKHRKKVCSASFSPDGRLLASGSEDHTIKLWDVVENKFLLTLNGHESAVTSVAFGSDPDVLISGSTDNTVRLWEAGMGEECHRLGPFPDESVRQNLDEYMSTGYQTPERMPRAKITSMDCFSKGNIFIAVGCDDYTIKLLKELPPDAYCPDSAFSWIEPDYTHKLGIATTLLGHDAPVSAVAFNPDGTMLASGSDDATIKLWNLLDENTDEKGMFVIKAITTLGNHNGRVGTVAFSPNGRLLASASEDATIKLWDVKDRSEIATLSHIESPVISLAFSPDGKKLALGFQDSSIQLWDFGDAVNPLEFKEDGKQTMKLSPRNANAHLSRGYAYAEKGDYDQAIKEFDQALKLNPQDATAYLNRGIVYNKKGDYEQAIKDINQALWLAPQDASAYLNRGLAYAEEDDHDSAIKDFTRALKLNPQDAMVYLNRGKAYAERATHLHADTDGDYARALADFNQALRLKPKNASTYLRRGHIYKKIGEHDRAVEDFNRALKFNPPDASLTPQDAKAYFQRGDAYLEIGEYDQAIEDYTQILSLTPQDAFAYYNRANAYFKKGEYDRVIEDLTQALKLSPHHATLFLSNRGDAYFKKGEYDRAIEDYTQVLNLDPQEASAYSDRGLTYYIKGEYDRAIEDYTQALKLNPQDGMAYFARGVSYYITGKRKAARNDLTWVLRHSNQEELVEKAKEYLAKMK